MLSVVAHIECFWHQATSVVLDCVKPNSPRVVSARPPLISAGFEDGFTLSPSLRINGDVELSACDCINTKGLEALRMSATSQYSEVESHVQKIKERSPDAFVIICDLHDSASPLELTEPERELQRAIEACSKTDLLAVDPTDASKDQSTKVEALAELAARIGSGYMHIEIKKDAKVDEPGVRSLLSAVPELVENCWVLFFGPQKTSTFFMAIMDTLKNADKVSFDDIMKRQSLLGGANLLADASLSVYLKRFHKYAIDVYIPSKVAG